MKICGIKLTHDGAVSLIDSGKLIFCVEMEKIGNNPRFTEIKHLDTVRDLLADHGYSIEDIDLFAIDGWGGTDQDELAIQPRLEIGDDHNFLSVGTHAGDIKLRVAPYREKTLRDSLLDEWSFDDLMISGNKVPYKSYLHATGHFMSTYASSPFAANNESTYMLIWDGGMFPRLYFKGEGSFRLENLGPLFLLIGNIYTIFSQHFGPFKVNGNFAKDSLSIAGKVMAYIAHGTLQKELFKVFDEIYDTCFDKPMGFANIFANEFKKRIQGREYKDEDILLTFHCYLEQMLIAKLRKKIQRHGSGSKNLCMAGGCALNIKWNSAIRSSGIFDKVYVSPFPNDSGSALGAAATAMVLHDNKTALDWSVYSGPALTDHGDIDGWQKRACSVKELAELLYHENEPVVFLNGKAELGPRALGNRSIIAPVGSPHMKKVLNLVKR
ncbi:MAG: carbamoyltransferase N-terminal domain-containing protein, partial [Bacteroidota bacterium]